MTDRDRLAALLHEHPCLAMGYDCTEQDRKAAVRLIAAGVGFPDARLREAAEAALIGMVRTSWPMQRDAYERGWNEAIHAARKKVRAALGEEPTP